jgi:hypothetical protein
MSSLANEQAHQDDLAAPGVGYYERLAQINAEKATSDAEREERWQRIWRAYSKSSEEIEQRSARKSSKLWRICQLMRGTWTSWISGMITGGRFASSLWSILSSSSAALAK